jgi:cytochrome c2
MPLFLIKSFLAIATFIIPFVQIFTMLEVMARPEKRFNIGALVRVHRIAGYLFVVFSLLIASLCLRFLWLAGGELSPRIVLHSVFAVALFTLLLLKIAIVRIYRGWYGKVPAFGIAVVVLAIQLVAGSAGYYFLVTHFGFQLHRETAAGQKTVAPGPATAPLAIRTDAESIDKGRKLFERNCNDCHTFKSKKTLVGPGLEGVLQGQTLPASGRPATAANIFVQLTRPYAEMPVFAHRLSDEDRLNIIAFLNTV